MNNIPYRIGTETRIVGSNDGHGNILKEASKVTHTTRCIAVSKDETLWKASTVSLQIRMNSQKKIFASDNSMQPAVFYGIYGSDDIVIQIALTQIGNVGGPGVLTSVDISKTV